MATNVYVNSQWTSEDLFNADASKPADAVWGDNVFTSIQDAVNAAADGATIIVASGTYTEDVVFDGTVTNGVKALTIKAADGADVTCTGTFKMGNYVYGDNNSVSPWNKAIVIDGLTFDPVDEGTSLLFHYITDLTVQNCTFTAEPDTDDFLMKRNGQNCVVKNANFIDCTFTGGRMEPTANVDENTGIGMAFSGCTFNSVKINAVHGYKYDFTDSTFNYYFANDGLSYAIRANGPQQVNISGSTFNVDVADDFDAETNDFGVLWARDTDGGDNKWVVEGCEVNYSAKALELASTDNDFAFIWNKSKDSTKAAERITVVDLTSAAPETLDAIIASTTGIVNVTVGGETAVYNDGALVKTDVIYVNSAWSGKQNGEIVGDGHIYGYNAFSSFADAAAKIKTDGSDTTIKILDDQNLDSSIVFDYGTGDVLFTADSAVTIKQTKNGLDFDFSKAVAADITVDENVTFEISDNAAGFYVYYGPNLTVKGTIKGGQNWGCLYLFNGTHTVSETGNVEVGRVQLASNTFTIAGSMDTNYLLVEDGTFNANNAIIDANVIYDNNNGQQRWGASEFNINNSKVTTSKLTLSYADSVMNVTGASDIAVDTLSGSGKINFTDAALDADTVINSGEKNGSNVGNAMTFRGDNTVSGSKIYTGWNKNLNVGDWNGADASASLTVTDGAELVYGGAAYIGTAAEDKGAGANKVTVTGATFAGHGGDGSLYLRRDGELEVKDNALASFSYVNLKGAVNVSDADFKAINVNFSGSLNAEKANVTISGDITEGTGEITLSNGSVLSVDDIVFGTALNIDLATPIKFDHTQAQIIVADAGGTNNMFTQSLKAGQTSINLFTNLPLGSYTVTILAQEADYTKTEIYSGIPAEITTYGSLSMDFTSQLKFSGDLNVPQGSITIDTAAYTTGTYKLIDYTGSDIASRGEAYYRALFSDTAWHDKYVVVNGDLYLTDQAASPVYLNSAYTSEDAVTDGRILNYNAFGTATGAFSSGAAEIIVESDINELLATDYYFVIGQDTKISSSVDGEARLVNFYNNGTSYDIVIDGDQSNSVRETLTIGKNVTLEVADRIIWAGYYGNDVDVVVDGTLRGHQLWIGADTTVSATGKLVAASEAFVLRRGAVVTLNGNAAQGAAAADRTASLEASYTSLLAGEIIANDTLIESGKIGANNAGYSGEGSIHVELDNTIWNSTGNLQLGSGVLFEVNNGSILNVTLHDGYQASSIGTTSSLWVDGGTVNASTMNVSGEIDVYNGKLNIASGKTLTINEGGKVFVRGASDVKAAVDGAGWLYIADAELDSDTVITGETANVRVVSGSSTVSGSELNVNAFQVGVGKGEDDLLDTLTGSTITFKDNAKLSVGGDTYDGWVGSQYAKRNEITDARYVLNVENSMMKAGYLHISADGILNVSGHTSDDNKYVENGRKVDFYAGDFIINGVANFSGTDAFIRYLKVSVDNTGTAAPGTVNITDGANVLAMVADGANNSKESFIIYNNGIVNVDNATFTVDDKTNIAAGGKLNAADGANVTLEGTATNNGTINVTGSTFTANSVANSGTFNVAGTSELHIDTLTGTVDINDGATVKNSYIGGAVAVDGGEVAFDGANTVASIDAKNGATVNINAGDSLNVTGSRTKLYNETINITGEIADALTADKSALNASLKMKGMSLAGNAVENDTTVATLNVTNAYVDLSAGDLSSKPDANAEASSGTYELNLTNSIMDVKKVGIENQSKAKFDIDIDGSVVNASSNFVMADKDSEMTLSNGSIVNINSSFKSDGTINILSGSKLIANNVIQPNENAGMYGTVNVDNAELELLSSGNVIGHAVVNEGNINLTNSAKAKVNFINNSGTVNITGSTFTATGAVTNSGEINVTGADAFVNANSISGNGKFVMTGVTLDDRWNISGTQETWQFLGDNTISKEVDLNGSVYFGTLIAGEPIADADKALVEASVNTVSADAAFDMARVGASMYGVVDGKYAELNINNDAVANIGYMQIRESGKVNITDGATVISNASSTNLKGILNIDGGTYTSVGGSVAKSAVITISNYGQWIDDPGNGSMDFAAGAKIQLSNNAFFSTTSWYGSAEITMDHTSKIVVNVPAQTNIAITVDTTGYTGGTYLIADFNKAGQFNTTSANTLVFNNDLYVKDQDNSILYVNNTYTGSVGDITADGKIIGYNAFANIDTALTSAVDGSTVMLKSNAGVNDPDATDDFSGDWYGVYVKGNVILDSENSDYVIHMGKNHSIEVWSDEVASKLTIAENVKMEYASQVRAWEGGEIEINGKVGTYQLWAGGRGGKVTINSTADVDLGYGDGMIKIRNGGTIVVNGDLSSTAGDRSAMKQQLSGGYISVDNGTSDNGLGDHLTLNNTYVSTAWLVDERSAGAFNFKMDNSIFEAGKLTLAANGVADIENNSIVDITGAVTNSGEINVTGSTFTANRVANSGAFNVENGVLNGGTVSNSGTIDVKGKSKLLIDAMTGTIVAASGATIYDSSITGTGDYASVEKADGYKYVLAADGVLNFEGTNYIHSVEAGAGDTVNVAGEIAFGGDGFKLGDGAVWNIENATVNSSYGLSLDGADMTDDGNDPVSTMNVKNSTFNMVQISAKDGYKDNEAYRIGYGTFNVNFEGSTVNLSNRLQIQAQETANVNINFTGDSEVSASHFINYSSKGTVTFDESKAAFTQNFGNAGTVNIFNGSVVNATYGTSGTGMSGEKPNGNSGTINVTGSTFALTGSGAFTNSGTISVTNSTFTANSVDNSGTVTVTGASNITIGTLNNSSEKFNVKGGEVVLNIADITSGTVDLYDNTIVKDSNIGGCVYILGDVTFRGKNVVNSIYDFGTYYAATLGTANWTVEAGSSLHLTHLKGGSNDKLYGLGYGDKATINGQLVNAREVDRAALTIDDASFYSEKGIRLSTSSGNDAPEGSFFTVNNAYVIIGGNHYTGGAGSFSNSKTNGKFTLDFNNSVVDAAQIYFSDSNDIIDLSFENSDVNTGIFMTADKDSVYKLDNSKVVTTATGNDRYNGNSGTLSLTNNSELIIEQGSYKNDGTVNITGSTFTANSVANSGSITLTGNAALNGDIELNGTAARLNFGTETVKYTGGTFSSDIALSNGSFATGHPESGQLQIVNGDVTMTGNIDGDAKSTLSIGGSILSNDSTAAASLTLKGNTVTVGTFWVGAADKVMEAASMKDGRFALIVDGAVLNAIMSGGGNASPRNTGSITVKNAGKVTTSNSQNAIRGNVLVTGEGSQFNSRNTNIYSEDNAAAATMEYTDKATGTFTEGLQVGKADNAIRTGLLKVNNSASVTIDTGNLTVNASGAVSITDNAALTVTDGSVTNKGTITVDGSTFTANSVDNSGTFNVTGTSTVNFDTFAATSLTNFVGTKGDAVGTHKVTIGSKTAGASAQFVKDANGTSSNIYFNGASVTLSSDIDVNINKGSFFYFCDSELNLNGNTLNVNYAKFLTNNLTVSGSGEIIIGYGSGTDMPCWQGENVIGENVTVTSYEQETIYGNLTVYGQMHSYNGMNDNGGNGADLIGSTYSADFDYSHSAVLTVSGANAGYTVHGSHGFTITTATNALKVEDGAQFTMLKGTLTNNGSVTINDASFSVVNVVNNSAVTMDWKSTFAFTNISGNGTFTVDLTGYKGDAEGKVVLDHATGWTAEQYKALLGSSWDDAYFSVNADGDLVLNGGVVTTVYINSNYSENGTNDGHTWGVDAFNNHADALAKNPQNIIVYDGTFTASCGHNGNTAVIESGSFRNVYAGGADGSVLSDSTNLTIKSGSFSNVYGGSNTNKPMSINPVSSTELNIENGTFNGIVIGGDYVKDGVVIRESSNLTISGGTFNSFVAGGVMLNTVDSSIITSGRVGDINFTISGGSFSARVYGGNFANKVVMSNDTVVTGDINLVIDATQNNIAFGEHIIAGSYGYGKVEGDVTVTFSKAADKTISFAADSIVLGGSGNAYTMVESDGTRTPNSFVYGERTVAFDSYSGDFGAAIKMFSDIDVTGNSNVNFTSSFSFADISDWDIEFGSSLSGIASNDFTGDTIDLDLTGFDGNDWTVMVGTENALSSFDSATLTLSGTGADQWIASGYGLKLEDTDDGSAKRLVFGQLA